MSTFALPERYPIVALAGISTILLAQWQGFLVGCSKKQAGIQYSQVDCAERVETPSSLAAMKFDCAQRARQNTLESIHHVQLAIFFSGLRYPTLAASLGGAYIIGRIMYTLGYISGDPSNRGKNGGVIGPLATIGLILISILTAGQMVWEYLQF